MRISSVLIALAGVLVAVPAAAADRLVDDALVPCRLDPVPIHATIQAAVDAAAPGELIVVCPGTYPEHVLVEIGKDDLTLRAQGLVNVVDPGLGLDLPGFLVRADRVTIQGFDVSGFTGPAECEQGAGISVFLPAEAADIRNNRAHGNSIGICLGATDGSRVRNNLAEGNLSDGIHLSRADDVEASGNTARDNGGYGIVVNVCVVQGVVHHNLVTNNQAGGIFAQFCPVVIRNNTVRRNDVHGIHVFQTSDAVVTRNLVEHSTQTGLLLEGLTPVCTANLNSVHFNAVGIDLVASDGCSIVQNRAHRNLPGPDCRWDGIGVHTFAGNSCGTEDPPVGVWSP